MDGQNTWFNLLEGLRQGDPRSLREFWETHIPVLHRLANNRLAGWMQRRVDPDDVVQSACRTFFRHLQAGAYEGTESQNLLSLLCAITLNKVLHKARFHRAGKRDLSREASVPDEGERPGWAVDPEPTPAEAAEFADELQCLLANLSDEERAIVDLKVQGFSNPEIASQLHRTDRWVRKVLERLRVRLLGD